MSSLAYHSNLEKGHLKDLMERSKKMGEKRSPFRSAKKAEA
jgi:hypothetical protein